MRLSHSTEPLAHCPQRKLCHAHTRGLMQEEWELACRQFGDLFSLQEKMAGQFPRSLGAERAPQQTL